MSIPSWQTLTDKFTDIIGKDYVFRNNGDLYPYGMDQTLGIHCQFDILLKPASPTEISKILKLCNQYQLAVTPRGGGSGVTGGALPINGGVVLSLERLNKIISIDELEGYAIAESGVVTTDLMREVEQRGLYLPVTPSSRDVAFIGGNVAENAGSPSSCKYGSTDQYIINLEVVLPEGDIIWTGLNVRKNATGLNLTQLLVGSEGTLGVITKIVFQLIKKPDFEIAILARFENIKDACDAIAEIKRSKLTPSVVELICNDAIRLTSKFLNEDLPLVTFEDNTHLLIEFQEISKIHIDLAINMINDILQKYTTEVLLADTTASKEKLRRLRYKIGEAMVGRKMNYRDVDVCIPFSSLYAYLNTVEEICQQNGISVIRFGHAFDGNMHTMLVISEDIQPGSVDNTVRSIYSYAINNGGAISGEHGIGLIQNKFMPLQFTDSQLSLMKRIKLAFDPKLIMNPGKMFN